MSSERVDGSWGLGVYRTCPRPFQIVRVDLRPCLNEPPLSPRKAPGQEVSVGNAEDGAVLGVLGVEVRPAVLPDVVEVERDDDAEELRDAGQGATG